MSSEVVKRNERLEGVFNRASKEYDSIGPGYFSYFGERLVQHAQIGIEMKKSGGRSNGQMLPEDYSNILIVWEQMR